MRNEEEKSLRQPRLEKQQKKRKINLILNSLIIIVLILIFIVSKNIFFSGSEEMTSEPEIESTSTSEEKVADEKPDEQPSQVADGEEKEQLEEDIEGQEERDEEVIETEGGTDANVIKTIVNPAWEPVGTVQTGEHVNTYEGVDWDEMVKAISYAINLDESEFTIYWLGNNGPNKSKGTVYNNGNKNEIYRVYIEWVDGKGWKPTKVEMLSQLAK